MDERNWKVELAPTGRATCRECKQLITQSSPRIAIPTHIQGMSAHAFQHLDCFMPKEGAYETGREIPGVQTLKPDHMTAFNKRREAWDEEYQKWVEKDAEMKALEAKKVATYMEKQQKELKRKQAQLQASFDQTPERAAKRRTFTIPDEPTTWQFISAWLSAESIFNLGQANKFLHNAVANNDYVWRTQCTLQWPKKVLDAHVEKNQELKQSWKEIYTHLRKSVCFGCGRTHASKHGWGYHRKPNKDKLGYHEILRVYICADCGGYEKFEVINRNSAVSALKLSSEDAYTLPYMWLQTSAFKKPIVVVSLRQALELAQQKSRLKLPVTHDGRFARHKAPEGADDAYYRCTTFNIMDYDTLKKFICASE